MRKFLTILGLLCVINLLSAQNPVTIHQNGHDFQVNAMRSVDEFPVEDIAFWVGSGSNSAVVIIGWDDNPSGNNFALAWGVHFNSGATASNLLDSIATYDSRVTYNIGSGYVTHIGYNDGTLVSGSSASYWCYNVNGTFAPVGYSEYAMSDGDQMEISSSCYFSLNSATAATDPNSGSLDATIALSQIEYWVGTGSTEVIFSTNWCDPETALAWGVRFNGTSATVEAVMAPSPPTTPASAIRAAAVSSMMSTIKTTPTIFLCFSRVQVISCTM